MPVSRLLRLLRSFHPGYVQGLMAEGYAGTLQVLNGINNFAGPKPGRDQSLPASGAPPQVGAEHNP